MTAGSKRLTGVETVKQEDEPLVVGPPMTAADVLERQEAMYRRPSKAMNDLTDGLLKRVITILRRNGFIPH